MDKKTKEEIIQPVLLWTDLGGDEWEVASKGDILNAMQQFSDQNTEPLLSQIKELKAEVHALKLQVGINPNERMSAYDLNEVGGLRKLRNKQNFINRNK